MDFLVGGGSALGMLGTKKAVSRESEVTKGTQGGVELGEGVKEGWEGEIKEVQGGEDSMGASGMLTGVTKGSIAEAEASTSVTKGSEKSCTVVAKVKIFS